VIHLLDETFNRFEWSSAVQRLGDPNILTNIVKKKLEVISHDAIKKTQKYLADDDEKSISQKSEICGVFFRGVNAVAI